MPEQTSRVAQLEAELAELSSRAHRVARTHQLFIEDHSDPGSEALGAQYELIAALSRSPRHEDLPLNPVETALRSVLTELERFDYDVTPQQIVQIIAGALPREDMSDNRRRLYVDGKGNGWISTCVEDGVEHVVPVQPAAWVEESVDEIAAENDGLREIGRCW